MTGDVVRQILSASSGLRGIRSDRRDDVWSGEEATVKRKRRAFARDFKFDAVSSTAVRPCFQAWSTEVSPFRMLANRGHSPFGVQPWTLFGGSFEDMW